MHFRHNQNLLLFFALAALLGCSKGKLEYRKGTSGCIVFPELYERVYTDTSTTMEADKIMDKKLKALLEKKDELQKQVTQVYLINTSYSDTYSFTIKSITSGDNSNSKTTIYTLQPGEELLLGCDTYINEQMDLVKQKFEIVGAKKMK